MKYKIYIYIYFFSLYHIIMVKVTKYKLSKKAKNKGIIWYVNKSKKELLQIIYKLKRSTDN